MNKQEFLQELREYLIGLSEEDKKEIIEDYEEHFKIGKKKKRKETEIAKALGDPKKIAREMRRELKKSNEVSFEDEAIEFWVKLKKLNKKIWKNIKREIPGATKRIENLFGKIEKKWEKQDVKSKKKKKKGLKIVLLILLNLFIVISLWGSLLGVVLSLIAYSWAILAGGIASILATLFGATMGFTAVVTNLLWAGLFAGIGITCLGIIFSIITWKIGKGFFWLTKMYLRWNKKVFCGGKKK